MFPVFELVFSMTRWTFPKTGRGLPIVESGFPMAGRVFPVSENAFSIPGRMFPKVGWTFPVVKNLFPLAEQMIFIRKSGLFELLRLNSGEN